MAGRLPPRRTPGVPPSRLPTRPAIQRSDDDEDNRITLSLAALAVILLLAVAALYLVEQIGVENKLEDCVLSGRTNCDPIDPAALQR